MFQVFVVKILHTCSLAPVHPRCLVLFIFLHVALVYGAWPRYVIQKIGLFERKSGGNYNRCVCVAVRVSLSLYLIFRQWIISDVNCVIPLLLLTLVLCVQSPQLGKLPGAWSLTIREQHMIFRFRRDSDSLLSYRYLVQCVWSQVTLWTLNQKGLH